ncbi:PIN domain-like protein [Lactifluus subvellereus]|nr:PIN domain-like protein [Lactifluus subvellereus]
MGVLGLTPFLQKAYPHVITQLPNRLKSLSNKTLVIDGTLVTQRFHFAPMPHEHRHVLGWYRLIQELREHDIRAICVFDGEERTVAKSNEQNRRRHIRRTDVLRGEIESDRLRRLLDLTKGINALRLVGNHERLLIMTWLRNQMSVFEEHLVPKPSYLPDSLSPADHYPRRYLPHPEPTLVHGEFPCPDEADLDELYHESNLLVNTGVVAPQEFDVIQHSTQPEDPDFHHFRYLLSSSMISQSEGRYDLVDRLATPDMDLPEDYQQVEKWQGLASSLTDLYLDYRRGVAKLDVMPTVISTTPSVSAPQEPVGPADAQVQLNALIHPPSAISGPADPADAQVQAAVSKTQYQLTVEEGKLWHRLTDPEEGVDQDESPTATILASLREKSYFMVESYLRRNNPPTETTYEESKDILRAMGVPCLESTGPFEAEALASSLVLNGCADYVASEDTDVLIYGAPLVRNITSRDKPLLLISGAEVRSALHLDSPAFVDFALLLGTDFAPRIRKIGPHRALQYIRKHGTIERVLEAERQYAPRVPRQAYLQAVRDARDVFGKLPPVPAPQALEATEYREGEVATILGSHRLQRYLEPDALLGALEGNYFNDNPAATF